MPQRRLIALLGALAVMTASAGDRPIPDGNFMLVLRGFEGATRQEIGYEPWGPATGTLNDGQAFTASMAWYFLIGDMGVRFVIDGETTMTNLSAEEFSEFGLTPEQAVDIALSNIRTRYGAPKATPWEGGIMLVSGESPDLDSSYFLDTNFWNLLLDEHPEGLVVGVPKRGGLIYAPVSNPEAVALLERDIRDLYLTSGDMRVSAALYLFKRGKWTVYRQPPMLH